MLEFPYDTQICNLEFVSVTEPDVLVNISTRPEIGFGLQFYTPSNEFILKSTQAYRKSWQVGHMHS